MIYPLLPSPPSPYSNCSPPSAFSSPKPCRPPTAQHAAAAYEARDHEGVNSSDCAGEELLRLTLEGADKELLTSMGFSSVQISTAHQEALLEQMMQMGYTPAQIRAVDKGPLLDSLLQMGFSLDQVRSAQDAAFMRTCGSDPSVLRPFSG